MTALAVGGKAPGFTLPDQTGRSRTLASLQGRNGLLLVFVRSADWCIFCKAELVELEQQVKAYAARGIQIAAITYDSPAVLKHFAERRGISYPLLSDEGSRVIRAFGILNETIPPDNPAYGVPLPVTYWLDSNGVVKRKYAEDDYRERISSASILVREFKDGAVAGQEIQAKHLTLRTSASNSSIYVGGRVMLILELVLPPKMHVYAPGVQGYKPIEWSMAESKNWSAAKPDFPPSRMLRLPAIGETVPVYEGTLRITRELSVGRPNAADGPAIVEGLFRYQACDDKVCYVPEQVPLKWVFPVAAIDSVRVPPELRKGVQ
jgi:peroxiredoxin